MFWGSLPKAVKAAGYHLPFHAGWCVWGNGGQKTDFISLCRSMTELVLMQDSRA